MWWYLQGPTNRHAWWIHHSNRERGVGEGLGLGCVVMKAWGPGVGGEGGVKGTRGLTRGGAAERGGGGGGCHSLITNVLDSQPFKNRF